MTKKRILISALCICLVAILACGSLAYFTDTSDTVVNQFKTAVYDPNDPTPPTVDELFSIEVWETDENGAKDYDGLTFEKVLPGSFLAKDPTVENTGAYDAWVRLYVTVDKAAGWQAIVADGTDLATIFGGHVEADWTFGGATTGTDTITYMYYYNSKLTPGAEATLFENVTIPTSITREQMLAIDGFTISIYGEAIQADNNGTTAQEGFLNW